MLDEKHKSASVCHREAKRRAHLCMHACYLPSRGQATCSPMYACMLFTIERPSDVLTYACMHAIYARTAPFAAHGRDRRCEGTGGVKASPSQSCMHGQHERLHRQWERGWRPHFSCGCHPHPHRQPITPTTHPHLRPHPSASSVQRSAFSVQRSAFSVSVSLNLNVLTSRAAVSPCEKTTTGIGAPAVYVWSRVCMHACMRPCTHAGYA